MSLTPPVYKDGFSFVNDSFYAETSNHNRHRRATLPELQALYHPLGGVPSKGDPVGHWYEAQLLHYGLTPSKNKAVAKTRLLDALNKSVLAVPPDIARIEDELKKEWMKRDRAAKKAMQSDNIGQSNRVEDSGKKASKRKRNKEDFDATATGGINVNVSVLLGLGDPLSAERASTTSSPSRGSTFTRGRSTSLIAPEPPQPATSRKLQTARRGAGSARGRNVAPPRSPKPKREPSVKTEMKEEEPELDQFYDFDDDNDDDGNNISTLPFAPTVTYDEYDNDPGLGPLGLINGTYMIESSDLTDWPPPWQGPFTLILCLDGTAVWGAYDFGMFSGIIHLPQRPWSSSFDQIPFSWRGRENGEGQMSFGDGNEGWIQFLGNGLIEGMINCYGHARFSGTRISGNETRAPRSAWDMRDEWEGYNQMDYDRENSARWGGSGGWW